MDTLPTETRPGRKVSWRRVLVALTVTFCLLGFTAGFFITASGESSSSFRRILAAASIVMREISPDTRTDERGFVAIRKDEVSTPASSMPVTPSESAVPSLVKTVPAPKAATCAFTGKGTSPAQVRISEIAWMGTPQSGDAEWIELANIGPEDVALSGWWLRSADGSVSLRFSARSTIMANGFFILERGTDDALPDRLADHTFSGRLSNGGTHLRLFDAECRVADEVAAAGSWQTFGGDTVTKRTAERNLASGAWRTSLHPGGTPGSAGEIQVESTVSSSVPAPLLTNGSIFISEVAAGKEGASSYEFVEIYNSQSSPVNLTGWSVKKRSSTGAESILVSASRLEGVTIPPGRHLLLGNEGGYSGQVSADIMWPRSYTLAYKSNGVVLYNKESKVDSAEWSELPAGKSLVRSGVGEKGDLRDPAPQNKASN